MQTTATAAGVKLFFLANMGINLALAAAEAAIKVSDSVLPLALAWLGQDFGGSPEDKKIFRLLHGLSSYHRGAVGGTRWRENQIPRFSQRIEQPDGFAVRRAEPEGKSDDVGYDHYLYSSAFEPLSEGRAVQLGAIHLLEGQAAAVEDFSTICETFASGNGGDELLDELNYHREARPTDPYKLAQLLYEQAVRGTSRIPLIEFILIVDIALMLDDLGHFDPDSPSTDRSIRFPYENYLGLLAEVSGNLKRHTLKSTEREALLEFQDRLLGDFAPGGPDMVTRARIAQAQAPRLIEQLYGPIIGEGFLQHATNAIRKGFDFRIDVCGGGCPLIALGSGPVAQLADYIRGAGPLPLTSGCLLPLWEI